LDLAQCAVELHLQFRRRGSAATAATAATAASAAASGDADMPGWIGDRSDGDLPGASSSATAASGSSGTGPLIRGRNEYS